MSRLASVVFVLGLATAPCAALAQEAPPAAAQSEKDAKKDAREQRREATDEKREQERQTDAERLQPWKWANFLVLAAAIVYMAAKQGPAFFAARSKQIRKDMIEAGDARKEADERAAAVERKLANLGADIARLREESAREREAETDQLRRHREDERAKIQAHADREIESAGKAARLDLKRYAAGLAVALAEQKIRQRMTGETQDRLVRNFVRDLEPPSSSAGAN